MTDRATVSALDKLQRSDCVTNDELREAAWGIAGGIRSLGEIFSAYVGGARAIRAYITIEILQLRRTCGLVRWRRF